MSSHVSHIELCYTIQETGVLFWSELGCMCTPCSRQDGLLRPRGATPEPPWRSDPRGVTGRTDVAIGTNKGSHLIMTSALHCRTQSSGDEANVSIRKVEKMRSLNQLRHEYNICGKKMLETVYSTFLPWCCLPFVHVVF